MMETAYLIAIDELCNSHNIDRSFMEVLHQYGLIEITRTEQSGYVPADQLEIIEKFIHLHFDLDINVEGIETISHLLERITGLQHEVTLLKNRLRLYEGVVD